MIDFLDKFEKRMEWIGVVDSIVNRRGKNTRLEAMFEENQLTNIIVSVLLFIMEKTLEENNQCDIISIERFLNNLLSQYYNKMLHNKDIKELASYIIKDILQNNGEHLTYTVKNYSVNNMQKIPIRLISDQVIEGKDYRRINYTLTNQGYDFLFRTREVDEEIQLTIEQFKLKEYVKRKKFTNAVRQSMELITYVRQKKREIENFILSIRQNIYSVDIEKYEQLINSSYSMLQDEYEAMNDIQKMIKQASEKINEELNASSQLIEKLIKAKNDIQEIHSNIGIAISEQRNLILNRYNLSDLYMNTIKRSFEYSFEKRFDFEEIILNPLENYNGVLDRCIRLLSPLFVPKVDKILGIDHVFSSQLIFKESEKDKEIIVNKEAFNDEIEKKRIEWISDTYIKILKVFLQESITKERISLSEIVRTIKNRDFEMYLNLARNRRLFSVALKLYDMEELRIQEFYLKGDKILMTPSEYFNVEYCLKCLENEVASIKDITVLKISKLEKDIHEVFEYSNEGMLVKEEIKMTDLLLEVVKQ
ncbi:MAG: hypothetical protein N4A48_03185 [Tepidibacter sp.]|jgi:hypothetical protein|uniref:hypothetical protein n=1 Tax=Tepidibacter sp. TaxID=2529387 RepID=UPI0025FB1909|nr:hypothetical protein [Tepidibacter sp.]MCT4507752.1 hypothetical protein [Tepidibacter sp.]